ncbi:membrane-bound lytic murein transglycosylase MltF [Glaciecola sp. MF2-115]|uniref:membrane-bound lytic murein transglycosylase MltF n=1 Tax=Glaciecola sp. MF2-115 TaxID=3384827 RepID=UPI0039A2315F
MKLKTQSFMLTGIHYKPQIKQKIAKQFNKIIAGSFAFIAILVLSSCTQPKPSSSLTTIFESGVLKVGSVYGRTTYYNGSTSPEGFEFELAQGFADFLGVKLEVYPYYSYRELLPQLDNNQIDLIAANITMTEQRKEKYRFGPAYQSVNFELVYKKGEVRPRDIKQLDGDLTIVANDLYREPLTNFVNEDEAKFWQETDEKDIEELLEMVSNDELDYTISDSNILSVARRRYPNLGIGFSVTDNLQIGWLLNKNTDDSLRAALIEYFGSIQSNGLLNALEDKYFGHVKSFDYVDTRAFIRAVDKTLPKFKPLFEAYAGDNDWRLLAAMSYQESHWNPRAKSPTGVRGMMMLTLGTAKDMKVTSRIDAEQSISGGARYYSSLLRRIPARIKSPDRLWMALAAYNVGLGHLEDARKITELQGYNPDLWVDVKKHLPLLRQKKYYKFTRYGYARGDEAVNYVANIRRYYDTLVWLEDQNELPIIEEENTDPDEALESDEDLAPTEAKDPD